MFKNIVTIIPNKIYSCKYNDENVIVKLSDKTELEIFNITKDNPHKNIVNVIDIIKYDYDEHTFHSIKSLFSEHKFYFMDKHIVIMKKLEKITNDEYNTQKCRNDIENGIEYLKFLGYKHNDSAVNNVMKDDINYILIDFDNDKKIEN